MNQLTAGLAIATLIYLPAILFLLYTNYQLRSSAMDFSLFLSGLKGLLSQAIANVALQSINQGHISRDDLLAEAHRDAQQIVVNALVAAHVSPSVPGNPVPSKGG